MKWSSILLTSLLIGSDARAGPSKELILNAPPLPEWAVCKIRRQLACLEGLHFSGYDVESSCLLIQFNPDKITGGFLIADLLNGLNKPLKFQEVKGYTIFDVIDGKYKKTSKKIRKK